MVTNVAFGDPDLRTRYITAGMTLFRIRLNVQGYVLWPPVGKLSPNAVGASIRQP